MSFFRDVGGLLDGTNHLACRSEGCGIASGPDALFGFPGMTASKVQIKGDHFDFSGGNRATQGQPNFGIQTKIQQPSSMASNINIR